MMRYSRYRYLGTIVMSGLLAQLPLAARADIRRTGNEPWYVQSTTDDRQRAQVLFEQAVEQHLQLRRDLARDLYVQALAKWDDPDIQWNLALVLTDLGEYLNAHQQLESELRWGEALGVERLRAVRERIHALETEHLAQIEAVSDEPGAEITLDGQRWFRGAGRQSTLVVPGEHYVASLKAGFFPVTRSIYVKAGTTTRVALPMDADRILETRRWSVWKPWLVVSAGAVVTAAGAVLQRQAIIDRDAAKTKLPGPCHMLAGCPPADDPPGYDRVVLEQKAAIAAFAVGGTALVVGLAMAWMNQLQVHRTEARVPAPIEVVPILSTGEAGVSARLQF